MGIHFSIHFSIHYQHGVHHICINFISRRVRLASASHVMSLGAVLRRADANIIFKYHDNLLIPLAENHGKAEHY